MLIIKSLFSSIKQYFLQRKIQKALGSSAVFPIQNYWPFRITIKKNKLDKKTRELENKGIVDFLEGKYK